MVGNWQIESSRGESLFLFNEVLALGDSICCLWFSLVVFWMFIKLHYILLLYFFIQNYVKRAALLANSLLSIVRSARAYTDFLSIMIQDSAFKGQERCFSFIV